MNGGPNEKTDKYQREEDGSDRQVLSRVLREHDLFADQRTRRKELLKKIEDLSSDGKKKSAAVAFMASESEHAGAIDGSDVAPFGDLLMSVGDVDTLNLIINSPGGDGTVAEKIIELCRSYCKKLRVLIPNRAKSAATIIALGADEIVMGHCSELGPIDAQVPIFVGGIPRFVSAQSFMDGKQSLEREFFERVKNDPKADVRDLLAQLATIDNTFVDHCKKLMEFSRDVARKNLRAHMFRGLKPAEQTKRIDQVVDELSSPKYFQIHGRMIDGHTAKTRLKLRVQLLPKDNQLWRAVWDYYVRTDVFLSGRQGGPPASKMIESRNTFLFQAASMQLLV